MFIIVVNYFIFRETGLNQDLLQEDLVFLRWLGKVATASWILTNDNMFLELAVTSKASFLCSFHHRRESLFICGRHSMSSSWASSHESDPFKPQRKFFEFSKITIEEIWDLKRPLLHIVTVQMRAPCTLTIFCYKQRGNTKQILWWLGASKIQA